MKHKISPEHLLLLFGIKNQMVERDLITLEEAGIDIGHIETISKDEPVDTELFEYEIVKSAKKMANFYVIYYSLENSVRKLIKDVLMEKYGLDWWNKAVSPGVKTSVEDKKKKELETAMSIRSEDPLDYTNFGELLEIINHKWDDFDSILRSKKAVQDTLSPLNKIRNVVAHSCELSDDEIIRFELLIRDWLRIQS